MITKVKSDYHIELKDAKKHLRLDEQFADDDEMVEDLTKAAVEISENYIEKDIAYTLSTMTLNDYAGSDVIITEGNLIEVTGITADTTTIEVSACTITKYDAHFIIKLPSYQDLTNKTLYVTFYSGYAADCLPNAIKSAVLITLGDLYDVDRSNYSFSSYKNNGVSERLLNFYKATYYQYIKN